ncbi:MAG: ice-binding family protein [Balneolia bacterium]|nr:ice-binding family protein [Balneolia bacterium]
MKTFESHYFSTAFAAVGLAIVMVVGLNTIEQNPEISSQATSELHVLSTLPADGDTNISRNAFIEVTFSDRVDSLSKKNITLKLYEGEQLVSGNMSFTRNKAYFISDKNLKPQTRYTAIVSTAGIYHRQDTYEHDLPEEYGMGVTTWHFTTGGNRDNVTTVNLGTAAGYVILSQATFHSDSPSTITGLIGFDNQAETNSEDKTIYWVKNEDVDRDSLRTRTASDERRNNANTGQTAHDVQANEDLVDEAVADMKNAYSDAEERSPVDFTDFGLVSNNNHHESSNDYGIHKDYDMDQVESKDQAMQDRNNTKPLPEEDQGSVDAVSSANAMSVTLEPGIYKWDTSVEISENITLSGSGDDVWIFQISDDLRLNSHIRVILADGAQAQNIFWQVGGDVNLEESSHFEGVILCMNDISMKSGATLNGRILAQEDITLNGNTISEPQLATSMQRDATETPD